VLPSVAGGPGKDFNGVSGTALRAPLAVPPVAAQAFGVR
jgi:hypothetical protein